LALGTIIYRPNTTANPSQSAICDFALHRRAEPCTKLSRLAYIGTGRLMAMNSEEINRAKQMALKAHLACLLAISDEVKEAGSGEVMAAFCRWFLGGLLV